MTAPITHPLASVGRDGLDRPRRYLVLGLALAGAVLFAVSWLLPYWSFTLIAPQYPKGLHLAIALTGVTGDVKEIDLINHYIGMHSLADAAELERALSGWIIGATGVGVVLAALVAGRKLGWLALVPALGLPVGFILDTTYWMWKAGHDLDPTAPIRLKPFMPAMFGEGTVGQFHTWAAPMSGFWLAIGGLVLVGGAVWLRTKLCRTCAQGDTCGLHCQPHLLGTKP